jgi:hypothetical protein
MITTMNDSTLIVLATVFVGQLVLTAQLRSWRALFEMLLMDTVLVLVWLFIILVTI